MVNAAWGPADRASCLGFFSEVDAVGSLSSFEPPSLSSVSCHTCCKVHDHCRGVMLTHPDVYCHAEEAYAAKGRDLQGQAMW